MQPPDLSGEQGISSVPPTAPHPPCTFNPRANISRSPEIASSPLANGRWCTRSYWRLRICRDPRAG
jgi:hypothetical protein